MRTANIFNSWIARRRNAVRAKPQATAARGGRALRFEACEPRIALSTTAVDNLWIRSFTANEGGWIASDSIVGTGVTIAVLDSGFSGFHPDEFSSYWSGTSGYELTTFTVTPGLGSNGMASDSVIVPRRLGEDANYGTA